MTPLTYISGGLAITSAVMFGLWQMEKADNAILKANQANLEFSIETQKQTIAQMEKQAELLIRDIKLLQSAENEALQSFNAATVQLNELRTKEAYDALQKPFERGNFASDMLHERLSAITRAPDRDSN